jgi:hypothetical protein
MSIEACCASCLLCQSDYNACIATFCAKEIANESADDLQRAYQLIKENKPEEAEALLIPGLLADPENVDAWWLMAYAVEDPNEVREALNKVLELDPLYSQAPKAREMLAQLDAQRPPVVEESSVATETAHVFGGGIDDSVFDDSYGASSLDSDQRELLFDGGLDDEFTCFLDPAGRIDVG